MTSTVVAIVAIATTWIVVRGLMAKSELEAAIAASSDVARAVGTGELSRAESALSDIRIHSAAAAGLTGDPVWRAAELLPAVGPNLTAVRVSAAQAHALTADVAEPLLTLATTVSGAGDSLVDLGALSDARPAVAKAQTTLVDARAQLGSVDGAALLPPLRDGVDRLLGIVAEAQPAVGAIRDAADILPRLLGADGPRTVLVMVQNNAEVRTGGGITGTFLLLGADAGSLSIEAQADSSDFHRRSTPILDVPSSTTLLYGDVTGRFIQDASITPDFDLTAKLASAWWSDRFGTTPDAVLSVDPLVLRAVLEAGGPVDTPEGTLTAKNLVQRLLVEPYRTLSQDAQTVVFRNAAAAVFTRLTGGGVDPVKLATALAPQLAEGRVSVWSSHADEQAVLAATPIGGPAARHRAAGDGAFALYLNDATGAKMDTFLDVSASTGVAACRSDGHRTVSVSVTLTSTAPADAGTRFPHSVTGGGAWGFEPGVIATNVAVAAPAGTFFGGVRVDGRLAPAPGVTDAGFPTTSTLIELAPGASKTIEFRFFTAGTGDVSPVLLTTPLVETPAVSTHEPSCS